MPQNDFSDKIKYSYKTEKHDATSLAVYNVGHEKCTPSHSWGVGVRSCYLIHHIISGKGVYRTPHGEFALGAGDTFLIYPNTQISYAADEQQPWEYYWVGFAGADAGLIIGQTDFTPEQPVMHAVFGKELARSLEQICLYSSSPAAANMKMTGQLYLALSLIVERSAAKAERSPACRYVDEARKYISYNYSIAITVEDIAAFVGVSRVTLFRAFTECEGLPPIEYLARFRITQAARLLRETAMNVTSVAYSVGFDDRLYFSRVFKKYMGVSPKEYARKYSAEGQL